VFAVWCSSAVALSPLRWTAPRLIDDARPFGHLGSLTAVSCPTVSFCVAVDSTGHVLSSGNPASGRSGWQRMSVDPSVLEAVSCPSRSLCVAGDFDGNVIWGDPVGGASAWKRARIDPGNQVTGIACPTESLCVAVDSAGNVITSSNPTGGSSAWTLTRLTTPEHFDRQHVACPTARLCVIVDGSGQVLTSTEPTGGQQRWVAATVDASQALSAVNCVSVSLCVAVDQVGNALVSTNPTGGTASWQLVNIDGSSPLVDVSCASASLCVALDSSGRVVSSTDPTAGFAAWSAPASLNNGSGGGAAVSCPSTEFCVAVDSRGDVVTTATPTAGASTWKAARVDPRGYLVGLSCPSSDFCAAVDGPGDVFTSTNPAGGPSAWATANIEPGNGSPVTIVNLVNAVACASASFCAAVDEDGNVMTSTNPVRGLWTKTRIDPAALWGISCPSASFCVATDTNGNVLVSSNPTGGPGAWQKQNVAGDNVLTAISCPSSSLCVAISYTGVVVSTDPGGGAGTWQSTSIATGSLRSITCPSVSLCVASDGAGHVVTSSNPSGGTAVWKVVSLPGVDSMGPISCPSPQLCMATGTSADSRQTVVISSRSPAGDSSAWTIVRALGAAVGSCPSASLCVGLANADIVTSTAPTAPPAASPWRAAQVDAANALAAIACPSSSLCTAIDDAGRILTTTNPSAVGAAWTAATVPILKNGQAYDPRAAFTFGYQIACATSRLCLASATSLAGRIQFWNLAASTDPAGGGATWSQTSSVGQAPEDISCPAVTLCVGAQQGGIMFSTHPTAGIGMWTSTVFAAQGFEFVDSVSCPTPSLCVASDSGGNVATSTDPTGGSQAWTLTHVDSAQPIDAPYLGHQAAITAVACPTTRLCVAVDNGGNVLSSTNPTAGARAWKLAHLRFATQLYDLACPSVSLCVATDRQGDVVSSVDPTGGAGAWALTHIDEGNNLTSVSCPTAALCVAADSEGNIVLGTRPARKPTGVTPKAAFAALTGALRRSCEHERLGRVLRRHGCRIPFSAPARGTVTIIWSRGGAKLAAGSARCERRRKLIIPLRLTRAGARLLRITRHTIRIRVKASFKDGSGHTFTKRTTITLVT
jgi:PQQ-like domain